MALLFSGSYKPACPSVPLLQASNALGLPTGPCDTYCWYHCTWLPSRNLLSAEALWGSTSDSHNETTLVAAGQPAAVVWLQFKYPENSIGFHRSAQAGGNTVVIAPYWVLYLLSCTSFSSLHLFAPFKCDLIAPKEPPSPSSNLTWDNCIGLTKRSHISILVLPSKTMPHVSTELLTGAEGVPVPGQFLGGRPDEKNCN